MTKRRKNPIDDVLDRVGDVSSDSRNLARRARTGKKKRKKRKKGTRKLVKRNSRAIEALIVQLGQYMKHDRERERSRSVG
ncbi:hypothetical protein [Streptomyces badius]